METIIFATNNQNKVAEIKAIIGSLYNILSLEDAGINIEIPEPHLTLQENAIEKSNTIYQLTGKNCFGEDTGLEVEALGGEPGVKSARYAGEDRNFEDNIDKLLSNLKNKRNRSAHFRTVISLNYKHQNYLFEGICTGVIVQERIGSKGFGYDAIFRPNGATKTFAEMDMNEKNQFSHRQKATTQLLNFLKHHSH